MQLEDYFIFLSTNDIRLKNTRIGIETVLYEYIYRSRTPEEITKTYPSLSLEQVYVTVLYYLHNNNTLAKLRRFDCCRNIMNTTKGSKLGKNLG